MRDTKQEKKLEPQYNDNTEVQKLTALSFSGGGCKGIVYVGALKTLEATKVLDNIDTVSGSSIGSFVAAMVAFGLTSIQIEKTLTIFLKQMLIFLKNSLNNPMECLLKGGIGDSRTLLNQIKPFFMAHFLSLKLAILKNIFVLDDAEGIKKSSYFTDAEKDFYVCNKPLVDSMLVNFTTEEEAHINGCKQLSALTRIDTMEMQFSDLKTFREILGSNRIKNLVITSTVKQANTVARTIYYGGPAYEDCSIFDAVSKSIAFPFVFRPLPDPRGDRVEVDGGILDNQARLGLTLNGKLEKETLSLLLQENKDHQLYTEVISKSSSTKAVNTKALYIAGQLIGVKEYENATMIRIGEISKNKEQFCVINTGEISIFDLKLNANNEVPEDIHQHSSEEMNAWLKNYLPNTELNFNENNLSAEEDRENVQGDASFNAEKIKKLLLICDDYLKHLFPKSIKYEIVLAAKSILLFGAEQEEIKKIMYKPPNVHYDIFIAPLLKDECASRIEKFRNYLNAEYSSSKTTNVKKSYQNKTRVFILAQGEDSHFSIFFKAIASIIVSPLCWFSLSLKPLNTLWSCKFKEKVDLMKSVITVDTSSAPAA